MLLGGCTFVEAPSVLRRRNFDGHQALGAWQVAGIPTLLLHDALLIAWKTQPHGVLTCWPARKAPPRFGHHLPPDSVLVPARWCDGWVLILDPAVQVGE